MSQTLDGRSASKISSPSYLAMKVRQFERAKQNSINALSVATERGDEATASLHRARFIQSSYLVNSARDAQRAATMSSLRNLANAMKGMQP